MQFLTRERLYKLVWNSPVSKIAAELGISGVALKKRCTRASVPTPPRGYWRQLALGKSVQIPELPIAQGYSALTHIEVSAERAAQIDILPVPKTSLVGEQPRPTLRDTKSLPVLAKMPEKVETNQSWEPTKASANPASAKVSTDPAEILSMVAQQDAIQNAKKWLAMLRAACKSTDPATLAVLLLWMREAEEILAVADPLNAVLHGCRDIALGIAEPDWWKSIQQNDSSG